MDKDKKDLMILQIRLLRIEADFAISLLQNGDAVFEKEPIRSHINKLIEKINYIQKELV